MRSKRAIVTAINMPTMVESKKPYKISSAVTHAALSSEDWRVTRIFAIDDGAGNTNSGSLKIREIASQIISTTIERTIAGRMLANAYLIRPPFEGVVMLPGVNLAFVGLLMACLSIHGHLSKVFEVARMPWQSRVWNRFLHYADKAGQSASTPQCARGQCP